MSTTTVDERVVSMQFDNRQFERNVGTSLGTIDKLKQSLNFSGASKSLDSLGASAKKVDFAPMGNAVESVKMKFSALQVMGVTALTNLTNSAVNAGKRIVSALTIDPVKSGFNEYELKMNSVKTIMASTGEELETVNKYLEELNEYSDQTIYSFSDMTQNIGKFTNAGVELKDAVAAIKGISNEAALSGANANEASRAMYNFAQALSAGYVKLIDWKSIELANMATVGFKKQLIEAAVAAGTLTKTSDGMYKTLKGNTLSATKNFNETLTDQWMTTEVLVNTLKDYADETTAIGAEAKKAATQVNTFSKMMDTLKETAQSGWAKTWEILFGDLNQATTLWTNLNNFFSGIIDGMSDFRNNLLEGALSPWDNLLKKFESVTTTTKKMTGTLEYYQDVVSRVWRGDYNNVDTGRVGLLRGEGYNFDVVQELVNKGSRYKLTMEDIEAAEKKYGVATNEAAKSSGLLLSKILDLDAEQLKNKGYTEEEIALLKELRKEAKKHGMTLGEFIESMEGRDGRTLLLESFANAGKALTTVFGALKQAWVEVFPPMTSVQLYNIIAGLNKLSQHLVMNDETADKLRRTFKGVFAVIKIITTLVGGAFKLVWRIAETVLGHFNLNILDFTAYVGDALVKFSEFVRSFDVFGKIAKFVAPYIVKIIGWFGDLFSTFTQGGADVAGNILRGIVYGLVDGVKWVVQAAWNLGKTILTTVCDVLGIHSPSREFFEIAKNCILGFVNGIGAGARWVWDKIKWLATNIGTVFAKTVSFVTDNLPTIIAIGLVLGLVAAIFSLAKALKTLAAPAELLNSVSNYFDAKALNVKAKAMKNFAIAIAILAASVVVMALIPAGQLWSAMGALVVLAGLLAGLVIVMDKFGKDKKIVITFQRVAKGLLGIGAAVLLLALALKTITELNPDNLAGSVVVLAVLIAGLGVAAVAIGKWGKDLNKGALVLIGFALAIRIMIGALDQIRNVISEQGDGIIASLGVLIGIAVVMGVVATSCQNVKWGGAAALIAMVIALKVILGAMWDISSMPLDVITKGMLVIAGIFYGFKVLLEALGDISPNASKAGTAILLMSVSLLAISRAINILGNMNADAMTRGLFAVSAILILFGAITSFFYNVSPNATKAGAAILLIAGAMVLLVGVVALFSLMDPNALIKGLSVVLLLGTMITAILYLAKDIQKCTGTMVALVGLIAVLVGSVILLSNLDPANLAVASLALVAVAAIFDSLSKTMVKVQAMGKVNKSTIGTLGVMMGVLIAIGGIIALLSLTDATSALAGAAALSITILALTKSLDILSKTEVTKSIDSKVKALTTLAVPLAAFAVVIGLFSAAMSAHSTSGDVVASTIALSAVMLAMAGVMETLSFIKYSKTVYKKILALTALALPLLAFAVVLHAIRFNNPDQLIGSVIALSAVIYAMEFALGALNFVDAKATTVAKIALLTAMVVPLAAFALVIQALAFDNPSDAISSVMALGTAALGMTVVLNALSKIKGNWKDALINIGLLTVMTVPLALFGAVLQTLTLSNPAGTVLALLGITAAMAAMIGIIKLISIAKISPADIKNIAVGIGALTAMALPLLTFAAVLTYMDGVKNAEANIKALVSLCAALVVLLAPLMVIGAIMTTIKGAASVVLGIVALTAMALPLMAFVEIINGMDGTEMATTNISAIITLMERMTDMLVKVSIVAPLALIGIPLIYAMEGAIVAFGVLAAAFGALSKIPGLEWALEKGIDILEKLSNGLGSVLGNFVTGFVGTIADSLPGIADRLSEFMVRLTPFIVGAKMIDESVVSSVGKLSEIFLKLSLASIIDTATRWLTGGSSITKFAQELKPFGEAMAAFGDEVRGLDTKSVESAASAGKMIAEMQDALPKAGGVVQWFTGTGDMDRFTAQLIPFGEAMVAFSDVVKGRIDSEAVESAASAGKMISELQDTLPKSGGVAQWWNGEIDFDEFQADLIPFGTAMVAFSDVVKGRIDSDAVTAAASAGQMISDLANSLPKDPQGIKAWFGDNQMDLDEFGKQIIPFAEAIVSFSGIVSRKVNEKAVSAAANAGSSLAKLNDLLPEEPTGIKAWFSDKKVDLETFGEQIVKFAEGIVDFSSTLGKGTIDVKLIDNCIAAVTKIVEFCKLSGDDLDCTNLATGLDDFATEMSVFSDKLEGKEIDVDTVKGVTEAGKNLADMAVTLSNETGSLSKASDGLDEFGRALVRFANTVKSASTQNINHAVHATDLGQAIADIVAAIPPEADLNAISDGFVKFGQAIWSVSRLSESINTDNIEKVKTAAQGIRDAFLALQEDDAGNPIDLMSTEELTEWSTRIGGLATIIKDFMAVANTSITTSTGEEAEIDFEHIKKVVEVGQEMFKILNGFTYTGTGTEVTAFTENATGIATAIKGFIKEIREVDEDLNETVINDNTVNQVSQAKDAADYLIAMFNAISQSAGSWSTIDTADIENDATNLAKALKAFTSELNGEDGFSYQQINQAILALDHIRIFLESYGTNTEKIKSLDSDLNLIATALKNFKTDMEGYEGPDLTKVTDSITGVITAFENTFGDNFKTITEKIKFEQYGLDVVEAFAKGITDNANLAANAFYTSLGSYATTTAASNQNSVIQAVVNRLGSSEVSKKITNCGVQIVNGFANGIDPGTTDSKAVTRLTGACNALVDYAFECVRSRAGIESPSKVFYGLATWCVKGFANAFYDDGESAEAARYMADNAINGLRKAISTVSDVINSDIDAQPTIRPVLDISNVEAGASAINGLLNTRPSVGVLSNLSAISMSMNRRQNGVNDDVVSAINDLGSNLGKKVGSTYNFGNITYDQGGAVDEAVQGLVRALRMEGRI